MLRTFIIWVFISFPILLFGQNNMLKPKKAADYYYKMGEQYFNRGNYKLAETYYDSSIFRYAYNPEAFFSRALTREYNNNPKGAISDYGSALYLNPELNEVLWSRAILRYKIGQYELAYEDLIQLKSREDLGHETNAIFYGTKASQNGVSKITTLETLQPEIFHYLGLILMEMDQDQEALSYFNKALEIDSQRVDYYVSRSQLWEKINTPEYALDDLNKALTIDPENDLALYNKARIKSQEGDPKSEIDSYNQILESNPAFSEVYAKRGLAKLEYGDFEGAKLDYDSAILLDPDDYRKWMNRGIIFSKIGQHKKAIIDLEKATSLKVESEEVYFQLGNVYSNLKIWNSALYNYSLALQYDPEYSQALYNRSITYYNLQQVENACSDLSRAISLGFEPAIQTHKKICEQ